MYGTIINGFNSGTPDNMTSYYVDRLFDTIEQAATVPRTTLARLEFAYLPMFRYQGRTPRVLHEALASDPALFAQMIEAMYKPQSGERRQLLWDFGNPRYWS